MTTSTWGKISEEQLEITNKRAGKWIPSRALYRDCTRDAFRSVARATGNVNPLFQDEDYAAKTSWGGLVAHPMFWITFGRLEGFGAQMPGFPGVHGTYAAGTMEFYQPIRLGDRLAGKEAFWEQAIKPSGFAGKMLDQISRSICVDLDTGKVVVEGYNLLKRWERTAASERKEAGKGLYSDWKRWVFSDEELKQIWDDFDNEQRRGATARYWEDVQVGEELTPLVTMPYVGREIIAFYMGFGAPFIMSNSQIYRYFKRHPGLNVPDALTKTPDVPERTHYEADLAQATGAPDMFDVTFPRMCWMVTMLTNWAGDNAFLRELSCIARRFNAYGDVTWMTGQVVDKYRKGEENLVKVAVAWDNQRYRHSFGHAVISLPSRERGNIVLPVAPSDPEGMPYVPVPEEVKGLLNQKDPGMPSGSQFGPAKSA